MQELGTHIILEYSGCEQSILKDVDKIRASLLEAARLSGATIIDERFHHFSPLGVSGIILIKESHLSIHTWPEYAYAAVDIFSCGENMSPNKAIDFLKDQFKASQVLTRAMTRGPEIWS